MATNFAELKKSRPSTKDLIEKLNQISGQQESNNDDRFWYPNVDKAGNGYAVIRFLPAPAGEDVPFIRLFTHGFKGPTGSWYIENSLTTIGKTDPVGELNTQLWNSGLESDKEIARKQKRKLNYIANIYVIEDTQNPENAGKVFLFKFGKKIFDKLNEAMNPQFADEEAINPFDLWDGANFKLKIRNVEGYRNYDKSEFAKAAPLFKDDEQIQKVWESEHSLQEFLDPKNFKTYEVLKEKLTKVLSTDGKAKPAQKVLDEDPPFDEAPAPKHKAAAAPKIEVEDEDEEEGLDFFKNLANR